MTSPRRRLIDETLFVAALLVPVAIGASRYADMVAQDRALLLAQQRHAIAVAAAGADQAMQLAQVSR